MEKKSRYDYKARLYARVWGGLQTTNGILQCMYIYSSLYRDGKEIEFGIVEPSWTSMPWDAGTYKVLSDGYKIVLDKKSYFESLKL